MEGGTAPDPGAAETGHFPDTYKKPNHPTFSDESIYHGKDLGLDNGMKAEGGHWDTGDNEKLTFTPGKTNLMFHSAQDLIDYFAKYEKNVQLNLPGQ
jgi:hypothetical protein